MEAYRGNSGPAGAVELWLVDIAGSLSALEALESSTPRLSSEDVDRFAAMTARDAARDRRAAHIALRLILERCFGAATRRLALVRDARGQPSLPLAAGAFSLSHTEGTALVGVAREGLIGVDVERVRPVSIDAWRRQEIMRLAREIAPRSRLPDEDERAFVQSWTRLEAVAKAEGIGIGQLLTRSGIVRRAMAADRAPEKRAELTLEAHDLDVGSVLVAAVALGKGGTLPGLQLLPTTPEDIRTLMPFA